MVLELDVAFVVVGEDARVFLLVITAVCDLLFILSCLLIHFSYQVNFSLSVLFIKSFLFLIDFGKLLFDLLLLSLAVND